MKKLWSKLTSVILVLAMVLGMGYTAPMTAKAADDDEYQFLDVGEPYEVSESSGEVWFEIVPEESGTYRFYSTAEEYADPYATLYDADFEELSSDDDAGEDYQFSISYVLEGGETYYLKVNDWDGDVTYQVYMNKVLGVTGLELVSGEVTLTENIDGYFWGETNEYFYYYYSLEESGIQFEITYEDGTSEEVPFAWTINGSNVSDITDQDAEPWTMGSNNYITLEYLGAEVSIPVTITEMQYQSFDEENPYQVIDSSETTWLEFVPEETGVYRFYSADLSEGGNTFAALYCGTPGEVGAQTNDDGGEGLNFSLTYPLEGGETCFLEVYSYDAASYSVYVERTESEQWSDNGTSHLQDIYGENWIEIKPTETKYYQLNVATTSNCYIYTEVCEQTVENMEYIADAEGYVLSTTMLLEAGKTYYAIISGSETPFSCDVSMKQLPAVTELELLSGEVGPLIKGIDSYAGVEMDYYYYELEDYDIMLRIAYEDGSVKDVPYSRWIDGIFVETYDTQFDSPWTVGGKYYITLEYCGVSVEVPVVVTENPVEKISFTSVPNYVGVLYENENDEDRPYNVDWGSLEGMGLLVEYKDGTSKTYSGEEFDQETHMLGDYQVFISTSDITESGTYTATFAYMGHEIEFDAQVVESTIAAIEVIADPKNTTPFFHPDFVGMQIQITYTDGTKEIVTVTEENLHCYTLQDYYCVVKEGALTIGIEPNYRYDDDWDMMTKYWNVNIHGKSYKYEGITWQTEKEIAELKASNVSLDAVGMILDITYTDNSTEQIVVDPIYCGGNETWSLGLTRTNDGVMRYDITAYDIDNDGVIDEYIVEVDGEVVRVNANDEEPTCTHVNVIYTAGKAATCTEVGNRAYWTCTCGKIFADEACMEEVTLADTVIASAGHTEEVLAGKAATCTATGLTEGKKCSICGDILVAQEAVAKIAHKEVVVKGKAATTTATGSTDGKKCSVCKTWTVKQQVIAKIAKPSKTKFTKVTGSKKKITIKFKRTSGIDGYEIQIATKKNMKKGKKTFTVKASKAKYVAKKLKAKTKYWVRIRTFKLVNGEKVYSGWSSKKIVKTK